MNDPDASYPNRRTEMESSDPHASGLPAADAGWIYDDLPPNLRQPRPRTPRSRPTLRQWPDRLVSLLVVAALLAGAVVWIRDGTAPAVGGHSTTSSQLSPISLTTLSP